MDSPFYRSYWNYPSNHRRYHHSPTSSGEMPASTIRARKKVVSIPVQYVGSDQNKSDSAVRIQKAFRGFLVRKSVKKIAAIWKEVNEIEKRMSTEETAELIRNDSKERLKLNETLMNLLLRLDAVRGVDSGVRDCRKSAIKKAISLQDKVDAIVTAGEAAAEVKASGGNLPAGETLETEDVSSKVKGIPAADAFANCDCAEEATEREWLELPKSAESVPAPNEAEVVRGEESLKLQVLEEEHHNLTRDSQGNMADYDRMASVVSECADVQTESQTDSSANPNALMEAEGGEAANSLGNQEENAMDIGEQKKECGEEVPRDTDKPGEGKEENKRSRELLERMMEDNQKVMGMMTELFERNAAQSCLLSSLSHRVERLEKALRCERLRRKKKKRSAAGSVADCYESTLDERKCVKKR